jgi:hypothetical protein
LGRKAIDHRCETDALSRLFVIVAIRSRDPVNDRPGETGKLLYIERAFVDPVNLNLAFEIEQLVIIAFARIDLNDDLSFQLFRLDEGQDFFRSLLW